MIVSNRVCSDSGRATNASGAARANPASAFTRYFVPQITIVNQTSSPSSDDREPVSSTHRLESPTYPVKSTRPRRPPIPDRHSAVTSGRANTMLAPKLFGSPRVVSTPIIREIPIR